MISRCQLSGVNGGSETTSLHVAYQPITVSNIVVAAAQLPVMNFQDVGMAQGTAEGQVKEVKLCS